MISKKSILSPNSGMFLIALFSLTFTSCFEIREEVNVNKDGTGDVKITVNLSENKEQVKKWLQVETPEGSDKPTEKNVESYFKHVRVILEGIDGISNIKSNNDYEDFIFTLTANFDKVDAVNEAVSEVTKQLSYLGAEHIDSKSYEYKPNQFKRLFDYPIRPEDYKDVPVMVRYALEDAKVVSIYRFAQTITDYSNKNAVLSPSKKAIKLEQGLPALAQGTATMENIISF